MHRLLCGLFCFILSFAAFSQQVDNFRVVFWNVENLFDTERDSLKQDEEFLPTSIRAWHMGRYKKKMADVSRVITAVGEWEPPALVGLCEVENDRVLQYLTRYSPLKEHGYRYVMTDSPDLRGVDVALLYQRDKFKLLEYRSIRSDMGAGERPTRDILHVRGMVSTYDTLDVFVVHFPSRFGGERASEPRRLQVAQLLRQTVDTLIQNRKDAKILIMGDFNDYPYNKSVREVLKVNLIDSADNQESDMYEEHNLYHLFAHKFSRKAFHHSKKDVYKSVLGSYKYQGEWGILDHLIVSGGLLQSKSRFYADISTAEIVCLPFLLIEDSKYGGLQPFRTYYGMKYWGGYSDHLPVRVDLKLLVD